MSRTKINKNRLADTFVETVNGQKPDANGDVLITNVESANQLVSPDNINDAAYFVFRTAGGTKSINNGIAELLNVQGNIENPRQSLNNVDTSHVEAPRVFVSIDTTTFGTTVNHTTGDYTFNFDGTNWTLQGETPTTVNLADYGITLSDTALSGDSFVINYTYTPAEQEGEEPTEYATATYIAVNRLTINVTESTFAGKVNNVIGSYSFIYSGSVWRTNDTNVDITEYGIIITGTAVSGDSITVIYNGDMKVAYPTQFKAIGLNAFNKATNILSGYTINASGQIETSAGSYVAYIHAVGGLENADAGTNRKGDYTIYSSNSAIVRVGWTAEVPTTSSTVKLNGVDDIEISDQSTATTTWITFDNDGYICVATTDINTLCVHPEWSGTEDDKYEDYTESVIDIPTVGYALDDTSKTTPITLPTYLAKIGIVADEISFERKQYINRIGYYAYSAENLETVQALGVDYVYDSNGIFYVLPTAVTYNLADTVTAQYIVADFGTEEFIYETGEPQVAVLANTLYGNNLVDKLRTDVLTKSAQSLSQDQKEQVWKNLGLQPIYNHVNTLEPNATVTINLVSTKQVYELTPTSNTTLEFNTANLTEFNAQDSDVEIEFTLYIKMVNAQQAWEITFPDTVVWGNTSPTMTAMANYKFSFCKPKGSSVFIGNQMYSWVE